ncbi:MAG: DNA mismatch repair endonuclease MutL [Lachnospiraceae bacterium]|nr:DNA mismatch repair endonuclease MutL [Lachnospiraceae bacterium]
MQKIHVLDKQTINKIAAGEVVERPSSVVKELMENAIDAGATMITVEIKNGGIDYIRVTDNGSGIDKEDIRTAFLRHATSKILSIEDLLDVTSLGFRGEALSSIAGVAKVELMTKTPDSICGTRYVIEGDRELVLEDAGVPDGTTIIVRNLFYNIPARRKFLKTAVTENAYITEIMEHIMLSRPNIAIKYIVNGTVKLQTSGDGDLKTVIYLLYGRDTLNNLIRIEHESEDVSISGYIGKPELARSNHQYEIFFVNHRNVKSTLLNKALTEAYKPYLMVHKYPFAILHFEIKGELLDVNVHPTKLEIRFLHANEVYEALMTAAAKALKQPELIPDIVEDKTKRETTQVPPMILPEPFETKRISELVLSEDIPYSRKQEIPVVAEPVGTFTQATFLSEEAMHRHRLIGQLFDTYWLVEYDEKLYLIDQHAAHEKIRYERLLKRYREQKNDSQLLNPPLIVSMSTAEEEVFAQYREQFENAGFELEHFGGSEYAIRAVPTELYGMHETDYFKELLDDLREDRKMADMESILSRLATISCKGAIKAGNRISATEADALIRELLSLENPYHCPHGRPVIISYSKTELEKKFKRIV